MAKELGINNLIVEMDALSSVMLMNNSSANLLMETLLSDCRNLLKGIPNKRIVHAFCEANQCADALTRFGGSSVSYFVVFFFIHRLWWLNLPLLIRRLFVVTNLCSL